jgi:hypothetical protein
MAGNIRETAAERAQARFRRYARRKRRFPKSRSIRTVRGGLPSLGKRR